jgi:diadenosine tetraphosphate (Ap4A) HIT family hydrolase
VARAIAAVARPDRIAYVTEDDLTGQGYNLVAHWKLHVIARFRDDAVRLEWGREPDPGEVARAGIAAVL